MELYIFLYGVTFGLILAAPVEWGIRLLAKRRTHY